MPLISLVDAFCHECENYMHDYLIWIGVSKCINRFDGMGLGSVNELARLQEAWCRNSGITVAFDNNVDSFQKLPQKLILEIKAAQILLQKQREHITIAF